VDPRKDKAVDPRKDKAVDPRKDKAVDPRKDKAVDPRKDKAVHLKSITLKGFKSFPDRTRLDFAPGVSVVVGPNGSGKSNVTDAVLWAMGEQSPVAVRGQSMQDVIFGGAPGRQAAKSAEVELVLDNSDGTLALELPEISILRRLDRTGDGEYRIAGARCRLVDVIELLSDTGLGKEMHSVISQGRVESIVTSKPRDRRLLIEEAAGLGKHRKRRRRAQLKLARTLDNLDRALDVEREARSRLRPLKRQAEAAELHARLERQSLQARWELARDDVRSQRDGVAEAEAGSAGARGQRVEVEGELLGVARRREAAEEALAQRSAQREELSRRCFAARGAGERVAYRTEAVRTGVLATEARLSGAREALRALAAQAGADAPDLQAVARVAALEASLTALEQDRRAELERDLAELEARRVLAAAELETRSRGLEAGRAAREAADAAVNAVRHELRSAERSVEAARREAARVGGQLAAVNQFLRAHAGAAGGAAALAATLQVAPGYELALAAALDGRLGAAVVPNRVAGSTLLDRSGRDGGRALVALAEVPAPAESAPPPVPGAERLADRVSGAGDSLALARVLLVDTWVVSELEAVPENFHGVAVTRSGRVWSGPGRELRQAPSVGEDRVLSERNRREELVRGSEAAAQAEVAAAAALERAGAALAGAEAESEEVLAAERAAAGARDEAAEEERRIARLIGRRRAEAEEGPAADRRTQVIAELASERRMAERADRDRAARRIRIDRLERAVSRDEGLLPLGARLAAVLEQAAAAITGRVSEFEATLADDRQAGEHVTAELRACAQAEAGLQARLHAANEAVTVAEVRAQQARDRGAEAEATLRGIASILELEPAPASEPLPDRERQALSERVERLARRREQLGPVNPLAQEEYAEAVSHVEELEHQRGDLETALRELEKLIVETDRQIRETFEETFAAAARNFEDLAAQLFPGGRGRLRLVAERDGPRPVLGGAPLPSSPDEEEDGPVDAMGESDDEGPRDDLDGVEIEVTPPGKEMKRLTLLSGGEKSMTALAFLFAVFLARPCPFYILDEVEAALDDVNIDRFLTLLGRYSTRAQFIVVTHQKRTMEAADCLYGVSMGADGISKVISRRLPREAAA